MKKNTTSLSQVKEKIKNLGQQPINVTVNLGRNKYVSFRARLSGVYPALFTVTPIDEFKGKTSYSYFEYMCGRVKIDNIDNLVN